MNKEELLIAMLKGVGERVAAWERHFNETRGKESLGIEYQLAAMRYKGKLEEAKSIQRDLLSLIEEHKHRHGRVGND